MKPLATIATVGTTLTNTSNALPALTISKVVHVMVDEKSTELPTMIEQTLIRVCEGQMVAAGVALKAFFREHQEVKVRLSESVMHDEIIALIDRETSKGTASLMALLSNAATRAWRQGNLDHAGHVVVRLRDVFPAL
ncbi:hypothetical protein [Sphingomonas sp. BAUL-RG-20F-R05-02]|uniref:hypothetical protein n=1 Tax=Sphingomonas sp. BAUL-RG-20F-R05-02 TaxID=2914830 RepID=UPI001F579335|nr:hypothetical protein [Sphingomonas sp. BAUL-RG-20F-R05-02]